MQFLDFSENFSGEQHYKKTGQINNLLTHNL